MGIKDKWLILPILLFLPYLLLRLVNYGKVMWAHPLSNLSHDIYSYAPMLHFLKACGFHASCPYWYNGFTTFLAAPPGWYLFTYPLYLLTGHLLVSYYISLVLIYVFIALAFWYMGKLVRLTPLQRIAFFAFFFGNNVMIGVLRMGRGPELFAWLFFIISFFILYYFKDRKLNNNIYWLIIPYTLTLISYHGVAILLSLLIFGLMLVKYKEQVYKLVLVVLASLLAASFWIVPLLLRIKETSILNNTVGVETVWTVKEFLHFTGISLVLLPIIAFATFYFYYKTTQKKSNVLFFGPALILVLLLFSGLVSYFPVISHILTSIYFSFMIFLIVVFLLSIDYAQLLKFFQFLMPVGLVVATLLTIAISLYNTPFFDSPTEDQLKVVSLLEEVDDKFLIIGDLKNIQSTHLAYYSYAGTQEIPTAAGHYPAEKQRSYLNGLDAIYVSATNRDCDTFLDMSKEYNVSYYIGYKDHCEAYVTCQLEEVKTLDPVCLYRVI